MSRFLGRSQVFAACGALLLLAGFVIGCGSGDDGTTQAATAEESVTAGGSEAAEAAEGQPDGSRRAREGGNEKTPSSRSADGTEKSHGHAGPHDQGASQGRAGSQGEEGDAQPQRASRGGGSATVRADANSCVQRFDRATCAAMAESAGTPSRSVREPADCMQVMSKSECEELARAQESARRNDESVNVEECIENPTPHCEEVLRPVLEAQGVTPRGAGK